MDWRIWWNDPMSDLEIFFLLDAMVFSSISPYKVAMLLASNSHRTNQRKGHFHTKALEQGEASEILLGLTFQNSL